MTFENHFSKQADDYARHRPHYPRELFDWLRSQLHNHELAWDAGTGNGQVAVALTEVVNRVVASDASEEQLQHAEQHSRVSYRHEPSDASSLNDHSVDLVTAGSAAHWFELSGFHDEVRRVAKRGAVVALFSYGPRDIAAALGPTIDFFQEEILAGHWPDRIGLVHKRYATLSFPYEEMVAPTFTVSAEWNLDELLAFLETWSASQRYFDTHGERATEKIRATMIREWGDPEQRKVTRFPLFMRAGRVV